MLIRAKQTNDCTADHLFPAVTCCQNTLFESHSPSMSTGYEPIRSAGLRSSTISIPVIKAATARYRYKGNSWAIFGVHRAKFTTDTRIFCQVLLQFHQCESILPPFAKLIATGKYPCDRLAPMHRIFCWWQITHNGKPPRPLYHHHHVRHDVGMFKANIFAWARKPALRHPKSIRYHVCGHFTDFL